MELELSEHLSRFATRLLRNVIDGKISGRSAAERLHKELDRLSAEFSGKGLVPEPSYRNYAVVKALSSALSQIPTTSLFQDYHDLFGDHPRAVSGQVISRAVAHVYYDKDLQNVLRRILSRQEEVLKFISHATEKMDIRDLPELIKGVRILNRAPASLRGVAQHTLLRRLYRKLSRNSSYADYLTAAGNLLQQVDDLAVDYARVRAILRAKDKIIEEFGPRRAEEIFGDVLAKSVEDGISEWEGLLLTRFNSVVGEEYLNLFKRGHLREYEHYFKPFHMAVSLLLANISNIDFSSQWEAAKDTLRSVFLEHKRVYSWGNREKARFLEHIIRAHVVGLDTDGERIYVELAKIHGHDPLKMLRG